MKIKENIPAPVQRLLLLLLLSLPSLLVVLVLKMYS